MYITTCDSNDDGDSLNDEIIENMLKIVVPEGMVVGLDPNDVDNIDWQYKVI